MRRIPGYHDEPLKGKRKSQRSVRLNRSYRLIYTESDMTILVLEVNKHEY
jgi:proteic killer suppression protein